MSYFTLTEYKTTVLAKCILQYSWHHDVLPIIHNSHYAWSSNTATLSPSVWPSESQEPSNSEACESCTVCSVFWPWLDFLADCNRQLNTWYMVTASFSTTSSHPYGHTQTDKQDTTKKTTSPSHQPTDTWADSATADHSCVMRRGRPARKLISTRVTAIQ